MVRRCSLAAAILLALSACWVDARRLWQASNSQDSSDGSTSGTGVDIHSRGPFWADDGKASHVIYNLFKSQQPTYQPCTPLHALTPATCLDDNLRFCPSDVLIISTGTVHRPSVAETQQRTLGKHFLILRTNETLYPTCSVCNGVRRLRAPEQLFKIWWRYEKKPLEWYCAQQRFMFGLADTLLVLRNFLPQWLVMVDDDTSVNPLALAQTLAALDSKSSLYLGNRNSGRAHHVREFANGGAGYAISRGLMTQLLEPVLTRTAYRLVTSGWAEEFSADDSVIEECKRQVFDGALCYSHSDWVVADCIHAASGHRLMSSTQYDKLFSQQACNATDVELVTCHYMLAEEQQRRYDQIRAVSCTPAPGGAEAKKQKAD